MGERDIGFLSVLTGKPGFAPPRWARRYPAPRPRVPWLTSRARGVSRAPPHGPLRCQPWRGRSSPPPRGCRPLAWSRAPWDSPAGEKKKRGASVKSNANRGFNLGHALQLADDASPSTSARTTKKLLKFWTRRRLALDTLSTPSPPLVQSNRVPVPNPVSKKKDRTRGILAGIPRPNVPQSCALSREVAITCRQPCCAAACWACCPSCCQSHP